MCQGRGNDALLDSYHDERHPVAEHVIKITTGMTRVSTVHNTLARRLRDHAVRSASGLAPIAHALAEETEETRVAYHDSPIVRGWRVGHGPRPGDTAPRAIAAAGETSTVDAYFRAIGDTA